MTDPAEPRPGWVPVGEDRVAYDGFVRVLHRTLRLPDGREALWDILDTPATVAVLALTPDDRVVMVRQYRPGPARQVLSLPGGIVDLGEDPADAAARELREETGYACASIEVVGSTMAGNGTGPRFAAVARGCVASYEQMLDDYEDCVPVLIDLPTLRAELRAGRLGVTEQTYLALDHAGLL
ncbi:NUDIX hydrolase [Nocardioides pacificus]